MILYYENNSGYLIAKQFVLCETRDVVVIDDNARTSMHMFDSDYNYPASLPCVTTQNVNYMDMNNQVCAHISEAFGELW